MSGNVWQVCLWYAWVIVCNRMSTRCGHVQMRGKVWSGLSVSKNAMHILSTQKRKQIQSIKLNLRCLVQHPTSAGVRLYLPTFAFVCRSVPMSAYVQIYLPTSAHVRGRRMPMHAYEILRSPTDAHDPVGCKKFVERLDTHGFEKHRKNEIRFEEYKKKCIGESGFLGREGVPNPGFLRSLKTKLFAQIMIPPWNSQRLKNWCTWPCHGDRFCNNLANVFVHRACFCSLGFQKRPYTKMKNKQ